MIDDGDKEALDFMLKASPEFKAVVQKLDLMVTDLAALEMELETLEEIKKTKREEIVQVFTDEMPRADVEQYFPDTMVPLQHGFVGWGKSRRSAGTPDVVTLIERGDEFGDHEQWIEWKVKSLAKIDKEMLGMGFGVDLQEELATILNIKGGDEDVVNLRVDKKAARATFVQDKE